MDEQVVPAAPGGVLLTLPPRAKSVAGAATGTGRIRKILFPPKPPKSDRNRQHDAFCQIRAFVLQTEADNVARCAFPL